MEDELFKFLCKENQFVQDVALSKNQCHNMFHGGINLIKMYQCYNVLLCKCYNRIVIFQLVNVIIMYSTMFKLQSETIDCKIDGMIHLCAF
jgi:hypothetical protein